MAYSTLLEIRMKCNGNEMYSNLLFILLTNYFPSHIFVTLNKMYPVNEEVCSVCKLDQITKRL